MDGSGKPADAGKDRKTVTAQTDGAASSKSPLKQAASGNAGSSGSLWERERAERNGEDPKAAWERERKARGGADQANKAVSSETPSTRQKTADAQTGFQGAAAAGGVAASAATGNARTSAGTGSDVRAGAGNAQGAATTSSSSSAGSGTGVKTAAGTGTADTSAGGKKSHTGRNFVVALLVIAAAAAGVCAALEYNPLTLFSQGAAVSVESNRTSTSSATVDAANNAVEEATNSLRNTIENSLVDMLVEHKAYWVDGDGATFDEYQIVHYGHDTHKIKKLTLEVHFSQNASEYLVGSDPAAIIPGFDNIPFGTYEYHVDDDGQSGYSVYRFNDLDVTDNMKAMSDNGILTFKNPEDYATITADQYIDWLQSSGAYELSVSDPAYSSLHLD